MGQFKQIDFTLRCESYGWPKGPYGMQFANEAYEREVIRYERQMNEAAEARKRDLERRVAGLHGQWQNLVGHRQYELNHKRQLQADLLLPAIQNAYEAWQAALAELLAWQPVWEGA